MKSCSLVFKDEKNLEKFIVENGLKKQENTLLQIFTSINEEDFIQNLLSLIKKQLPNIKIIGTTSSGEILNGKSYSDSTLLTFTTFNQTKLVTKLMPKSEKSFDLGKDLINTFSKDDLQKSKVLISFASGLSVNADEYLEGINSVKKDIVVSGGLAADKYEFKKTLVFNENQISQDGAVIALLVNKNLNVFTNYNYNWKSIGKSHIVKKSNKNRIYKIDDMTAVEFYKHYLGEKLSKRLPRIGIEFPIIVQKKNIDVARVVLAVHDDGSITVGGNIKEGSEVKIGYGNTRSILEETVKDINQLNDKEIESLFIYSCSARKELLKENIDYELEPYAKILENTSGFFTYGEFFHFENKSRLLNETMTVLGLSEGSEKLSFEHYERENIEIEENTYEYYKSQALSQIVAITSDELENLNKNLEKRVLDEVAKSRQKDLLLEANFKYAQMGEIIDMIVHQFRQPLNVLSSVVSGLKLKNEFGMLQKEDLVESFDVLEKNIIYSSNTIEDFRTFFNSNTKNEKILPEKVLDNTITLINSLFSKYKIELVKEIKYFEPIEINTSKMMQVLLNIIKNAIDEIARGHIDSPRLIIRIYESDNSCIFEIEDNAGGIPEEVLPKIFEKGFTTKQDLDGTGIGLDMSKNLVQKHLYGDISVKNSQDGAVFTIKITT